MHRPGNRPGTGLRIAVPVTAAALFLLAPGAGTASAVDRPTDPGELTLIDTDAGPALADRAGNPLYLRTADRAAGLRCTGACARTWPAATGFPARGRGVTALTSRTLLRAANSGRPQVVYNGYPLYYYKNDRPNRPLGHHVPGFSLVAPNGTALTTGAGTGAGASTSPRPAVSPRPSTSGTISATSRARPRTTPAPATATATASATRKTPVIPRTPVTPRTSATPRASVTPGTPVTPRVSVSPRASVSRRAFPASSPAVGAIRVTPSGAARGGADHPVAAADATGPGGRDRVARLSLAIGTTAAASAGTILLVRRLQRRTTGGEP
ncbi:hypothetical protein ACIQ7D_36845 [Streptomyces sp. NPDC096310]|uniref:hypothetical protein n=1 Tax=Streptomyces sp. NPDC096310 TaxID=3366082 RepID=UPI0037F379E0